MRADRPGRFSDGRTAESRPVMVRVLSTGLEIRGGDGLLVAVWRTEDLLPDGELADRPGVRLRCTAEPDARLVVEDAYFIVESLPEIAAAPAATRRRRASALAVALRGPSSKMPISPNISRGPSRASTTATIQKRITMVGSDQPSCS